MKFRFVGIFIFALLGILQPLNAGDNHFMVASNELQDIYKQFKGISLYDAVEELLGWKVLKEPENNVSIRFNFGGVDNCLYIGHNNILEIRIKNDSLWSGAELGFVFECTAGNIFQWDSSYGTITPTNSPMPNVIRVNSDVFENRSPWIIFANCISYPDSIALYGIHMPNCGRLPVQDTAITVYSMRIWIPNDTSLIGEQFCIDNAWFPNSNFGRCEWNYSTIDGDTGVPSFQGVENASVSNPDAPPVCFDIIGDPQCASDKSSSGSDNFEEWADDPAEGRYWPHLKKSGDYKSEEFYHDKNGEIVLQVKIKFDGDVEDLEKMGVDVAPFRKKGYSLYASFPLSLLPKVCQIPGVKTIRLSEKTQLR